MGQAVIHFGDRAVGSAALGALVAVMGCSDTAGPGASWFGRFALTYFEYCSAQQDRCWSLPGPDAADESSVVLTFSDGNRIAGEGTIALYDYPTPTPTPDDIRLPFYILGNSDGAQEFEGFYEVRPGRVIEFAFLKTKGADTWLADRRAVELAYAPTGNLVSYVVDGDEVLRLVFSPDEP